MAIDYKKIAAEAAELVDHNETKAGGDFERQVPAAGVTMGRFIEYIELGDQPQRAYKGEAKEDCPTARFTFELLAKKNLREVDVDGEKKVFADRISFDLPIKLGAKASFKKLYEAMRYGRSNISHMSHMLNDAFVITVVHNEVEKDGKKKVYANIKDDSGYLIKPPVIVDPVEGTETKVPVPQSLSDVKIFIWERPCKESWASLEIEGTRTVKDEKGNETEVSKNWLQEKILAASNFQGSPLEDLLTGSEELTEQLEAAEVKTAAKKSVTTVVKPSTGSTESGSTTSSKTTKSAPAASKTAPVVKKAASPQAAVTKKIATAKAAPAAEAIDPLAALGLN